MRDLELLRHLYPEPVAATGSARSRARSALLARIEASGRRSRRRRLALVAALAAGALGAAALVGLGTRGGETATAATLALREAAAVARTQPPPEQPGRGEYLYVKSVDAYLGTNVYRTNRAFSALVPHIREVWLGPDGGQLRVRSGEARFLSERDRQTWIELGRPKLGETQDRMALDAARRLDLPADPDALWERLQRGAEEGGSSRHDQMFTLVGDSLRETSATPAQRAALYEVAARIPGVELLGRVADRAGRPGLAVARVDEANRIRHTLIFDPGTSELLGEEQAVVAGNAFGYAAGTVIGYATYVESAVVDSLDARPRSA